MSLTESANNNVWANKKTNTAELGDVVNSGDIQGKVTAITGNSATHTDAIARHSGNGVGVTAYTGNWANQRTKAQTGDVLNTGNISGEASVTAGKNTSKGIHEYSTAVLRASGNGISNYARTSNGRVEAANAILGNVENKGTIEGKAFAKAGSGYGNLYAQAYASGNGISTYVDGYGQESSDAIVGKISNDGAIKGNVTMFGGKDQKAVDANIDYKEFHSPIYESSMPKGTDNDASEINWIYKPLTPEQIAEMEAAKLGYNEAEAKLNAIDKEIDKERVKLSILAINSGQEEILILNELKASGKDKILKTLAENEKEIKKAEGRLPWTYDKEKLKAEIAAWKAENESLHGIIQEIEAANSVTDSLKEYYTNYTLKPMKEEIADLKLAIEKKEGRLPWTYDKEKLKAEIAADQLALAELEKDLEAATGTNAAEEAEIKAALAQLEAERDVVELEQREYARLSFGDHIAANVQTTMDVKGAGNGILIQNNAKGKVDFDGLENKGVISGYADIQRGNSQGISSRVAHELSGAGLAIKGNTDSKISNAGIISGSNFALLAEGRKNDEQSIANPIFESGFKAGVDNYGILAGRVIIGGFEVSGMEEEGYRYFETIYNKENPHKNYGMYLRTDKNQEIIEVIAGEEKGQFEGKDIVNLTSVEGNESFAGRDISNKIVNGIGHEGVVKASADTTISNSIVNGYHKAATIDGARLTVTNSTLNTNGFGESFAVQGSDKADSLVLTKASINGDIMLGAGDDSLALKGENYLNGKVDLGEGNNSLRFEASKAKGTSFSGTVSGVKNLEVATNLSISPMANIDGVEEVRIEGNKQLEYMFVDKEQQGFKNMDGKVVPVYAENGNKVSFRAVGDKLQVGKAKDILGFEFAYVTNPAESKAANFIIDSRILKASKRALGSEKAAIKSFVEDTKAAEKNLLEDQMDNIEVFKAFVHNNVRANTTAVARAEQEALAATYHRLLEEKAFVEEGKTSIYGNYVHQENDWAAVSGDTRFDGGYAEVQHGLAENWNGSLIFGGGDLRLASENADQIFAGANLKYNKNAFTWNNSLVFQHTDLDNSGSMKAISAETQAEYAFQTPYGISIIPSLALRATRLAHGDMKMGDLEVHKEISSNFAGEAAARVEKAIALANGSLRFAVEAGYQVNQKNEKQRANWKGGNTAFEIDAINNQDTAHGEVKVSYEHMTGLGLEASYRAEEKENTASAGISYKF